MNKISGSPYMEVVILMKRIVNAASPALRRRIYSLPFIGFHLKKLVARLFYTKKREWLEFRYGPRKGMKMKLKLPEENEFYLETHDSYITHFLCSYIKAGSVFVDIGAHIGYFTILASKIVGSRGKVFAIEPSLANSERLKEHLVHNRCSHNTHVIRLAIWHRDSNLAFVESQINTMSKLKHLPSEFFSAPDKSYNVQCRTLDSLIKDGIISPPDFIKIDAEGSEFNALEGAEHLLNQNKPALIVELVNVKAAEEITDFLKSINYIPYRIDTHNPVQILHKKLMTLVQERPTGMNFLFVRERFKITKPSDFKMLCL